MSVTGWLNENAFLWFKKKKKF